MSNKVYEDILLPIILRKLSQDPTVGDLFRSGLEEVRIEDRNLERFVLQELNKRLGINGKVTTDAYGNVLEDEYCEALETTLREMQERNPEELEALLEKILQLYVKLGEVGWKQKRAMPSPYFRTREEIEREKKERKPREMVKAV